MTPFPRHTPWTQLVAGLLLLDAAGGASRAIAAGSELFTPSLAQGLMLLALPLAKAALGILVLRRQRRALLLTAGLYLLQVLGIQLASAHLALSDFRLLGVMFVLDSGTRVALDLSALALCLVAIKAYGSASTKTPVLE